MTFSFKLFAAVLFCALLYWWLKADRQISSGRAGSFSPPPELVPFRTPGGTLHTNGFLKTETLQKETGSWRGTTSSSIRLNATYRYDIELRSKDWNIYIDDIVPKDGGYVVNFAYGRRGATLATGTKTNAPVAHDEARRIYDKLVAEKTAKGYTPGADGAPYQGTEKAVASTGIHCQLLNPVEEVEADRLIADPAWWMQEKHDGRRLLIRKMGESIIYPGES